jgi:8-amino-7-oxononanoate synthase
VDGRELLAFCSNDYLGLANHRKIKLALQEGADLYGVGSGAAPDQRPWPRACDAGRAPGRIRRRHLEAPRALSFCTGYMANLAVITGLTAGDKTPKSSPKS